MHLVLYEPDIPWNTGNVGRTAVATGSTLHLVGRLGFSLNEATVRRAGLDYWKDVTLRQHASWEAFDAQLPAQAALYFFTKKSKRSFWEARFEKESYLIFGCETKGLPDRLLERYADRAWAIPMEPASVRSLNLSTAAGIVLYEALRQNGYHGQLHD